MSTCIACGAEIEPDWNACRFCGRAIEFRDLQTTGAAGSPGPEHQVELISREWSAVDIDGTESTPDVLEAEEAPPLAPGAIEVSVDGISVVTDAADGSDLEATPTEPEGATDSWAHLRPHGEMPPRARRVSIAARTVQLLAIATAVVTLGAGAIHFYLNTQIEALSRGEVSATSVSDLELVADLSLVVVAGLILLTLLGFIAWRWRIRDYGIRNGRAGAVALLSLGAGIAVVVTFHFLRQDTITESIAANSLIILGLGLLIAAALVIAPTVGRIDQRVHW